MFLNSLIAKFKLTSVVTLFRENLTPKFGIKDVLIILANKSKFLLVYIDGLLLLDGLLLNIFPSDTIK